MPSLGSSSLLPSLEQYSPVCLTPKEFAQKYDNKENEAFVNSKELIAQNTSDETLSALKFYCQRFLPSFLNKDPSFLMSRQSLRLVESTLLNFFDLRGRYNLWVWQVSGCIGWNTSFDFLEAYTIFT